MQCQFCIFFTIVMYGIEWHQVAYGCLQLLLYIHFPYYDVKFVCIVILLSDLHAAVYTSKIAVKLCFFLIRDILEISWVNVLCGFTKVEMMFWFHPRISLIYMYGFEWLQIVDGCLQLIIYNYFPYYNVSICMQYFLLSDHQAGLILCFVLLFQ